jgi:hypothetical protein
MEWSLRRGEHRHGRWLTLVIAVGMLVASPREMHDESMDVASLSLSCRPVAVGAQCNLLALSREAAEPPRDVTGWASWYVGGGAEMYLSPAGVMQAIGEGDVAIETVYASKRAHVTVRLTPGQPALILATLRGAVYVYDRGRLRPVADARVEVASGPSLGKQTTTGADGTYELPALPAGSIAIRVTKLGFTPADLSTQIQPGDNRISPVIAIEPPARDSAL